MNHRVAVSCGTPEGARRYTRALQAVGIVPVVVAPPERKSLAELRVEGLLLSGGTDVDPEFYGQDRDPESDEPDRDRDVMEKRLLDEALRADLPVLGICRGLQFLNVCHGGTLFQHHPHQATHSVRTPDASLPAHDVFVEPGTHLAAILGDGCCSVNSRHHQAADRLGDRLLVSARAADGTVEGLERDDRTFVVSVQWHPEDQSEKDARQRKLFEAFRDALKPE